MDFGRLRLVVCHSWLGFGFFFPSIWNMCGVDVYLLYPGQISSSTRDIMKHFLGLVDPFSARTIFGLRVS